MVSIIKFGSPNRLAPIKWRDFLCKSSYLKKEEFASRQRRPYKMMNPTPAKRMPQCTPTIFLYNGCPENHFIIVKDPHSIGYHRPGIWLAVIIEIWAILNLFFPSGSSGIEIFEIGSSSRSSRRSTVLMHSSIVTIVVRWGNNGEPENPKTKRQSKTRINDWFLAPFFLPLPATS